MGPGHSHLPGPGCLSVRYGPRDRRQEFGGSAGEHGWSGSRNASRRTFQLRFTSVVHVYLRLHSSKGYPFIQLPANSPRFLLQGLGRLRIEGDEGESVPGIARDRRQSVPGLSMPKKFSLPPVEHTAQQRSVPASLKHRFDAPVRADVTEGPDRSVLTPDDQDRRVRPGKLGDEVVTGVRDPSRPSSGPLTFTRGASSPLPRTPWAAP